MRQIFITKAGTPSVLELRETQDVEPQEGHVRIRVRASGINFADLLARKGIYPDCPPFPCVVGYEVSGVIDAIGLNVDKGWLNAQVIALTKFGGYSDTVFVPVTQIVRKPTELSFIDAAAIPVVYLTAWILVYTMGGLRSDQSLLIQNAGSGVGLAAIDVAKLIGCKTIIGTASSHKHNFLKDRGLTHPVDYSSVSQLVNNLTNGKGVDLIIDPIGGDSWKQNFALLRKTGRLGVFGASTLTSIAHSNIFSKLLGLVSFFLKMPRYSPLSLMDTNKGVFGVNLGHLWDEADRLIQYLQVIIDSAGKKDSWVHPFIDSVYEFDRVADAHAAIENRATNGKVILVPKASDAIEWNRINNK
jgi:NADPH:quinone reductase-like Zn-dependent oxidoreductase